MNEENTNDATSIHRGSSIRVDETPVGKGVFTDRPFPIHSVVGDITGRLIKDRPYGSSYSIEVDENTQLEPHAPFRFLNHSCNPNCEFDWYDEAVYCDNPVMFVIALRDIEAGEELTIDYNWPAEAAIRCECGEDNCRGWVVSLDVVDQLVPAECDGGSSPLLTDPLLTDPLMTDPALADSTHDSDLESPDTRDGTQG